KNMEKISINVLEKQLNNMTDYDCHYCWPKEALLYETAIAEKAKNPEMKVIGDDDMATLRKLVKSLNKKEELVLTEHLGFEEQPLTLIDIAKKHNIAIREAVSIFKKGLTHVKELINENDLTF
ncbi:MAG: hypothetical protein RR400_01330, partial [Clostridia bacterium]